MPSSASVPAADYDGRFTVSWAASSTAASYIIQQRFNGGSWTTLNSNVSSTSYHVSGKASGTYQYGIRACNASGCSGTRYTGVLINTLPPSYLSVPSVDYDGAYTLRWGSVSTKTYYVVQERVGSGGWSSLLTRTTATSYTRSGRGSTSYQYRVAACNAKGCSPYRYSATLHVVLRPNSISYANKDHDGTYTVGWARVSSATSYQVQQYAGGRWLTIYNGAATNTTLSNKTDGYYYYRVRACRNNGCSSYRQGQRLWVIRPNLRLTWNPISVVTIGHYSLLSWQATGADYCTRKAVAYSIPGSSNVPVSGSLNVTILKNTTAEMTCYFGTLSKTVTSFLWVEQSGITLPKW